MALITIDKASLAFGAKPLLTQVSLAIEKNDKIALIGRNGAGKSSLLKAIAGTINLDDGNIYITNGLKIVYTPQEPILNLDNTIRDELLDAFGTVKEKFQEYDNLLAKLEEGGDPEELPELLAKLHELQIELEHSNLWQQKSMIDKTLAELELDGTSLINSLSGGLKKESCVSKSFNCGTRYITFG